MQRVYNCHLDAIAFIRQSLGCTYEKALRMAQLYGYLEHLAARGGAAALNQSAYSSKTGCHRATIRGDLKALADAGWLEVMSDHSGTSVRVLGIPFDQPPSVGVMDTACPGVGHRVSRGLDTACPSDGYGVSTYKKEQEQPEQEEHDGADLGGRQGPEEEPPIWRTRPRNWTRAKKEEVVRLWNENRPSTFQPITVESLNNDRCQTVARLMDGAGGYKRFVDQLPGVLSHWSRDQFWSNAAKGPFTWESVFGTVRERKQHLLKALDSLGSADQGLHPDRPPLRFEPLGDQWIDQRSGLTDRQRIELAVGLVKAGAAPAEALSALPGWTPAHPANDQLPQPA